MLLNVKVIVISIIVGALKIMPKNLEKRNGLSTNIKKNETAQTIALTSRKILGKVLESLGALLSLKLQWKPSVTSAVVV